jgi:hypothetical protein
MINIIPYLNIEHDYMGTNCISLIASFYEKELGISWVDEKNEFLNFKVQGAKEVRKIPISALENLKNWTKINLTDIKPFDIIVLVQNDRIKHFVMYVGEGKVLDLKEKSKSVLRYLNDKHRDETSVVFRHRQMAS